MVPRRPIDGRTTPSDLATVTARAQMSSREASAGIVRHEAIVRDLTTAGWDAATEASFSIRGERGSIDVLAFHPVTSTVLVVEVKSVVPDVQATLVTLDRKTRLASEIARQRGWRPARVGRLLVIRDDRTARRRIAAHETTFAGAFPIRPSPSAVRRPTPAAPSPDGCRSHRRTAHPASSLDCNSCQVHARGRSSSGRGAAIGHDGRTRHERRQNPRGPRPATSRLTAWRPHVGTSRTCARQRHAWQNPPTRRPNGSARGRSRLGRRLSSPSPPLRDRPFETKEARGATPWASCIRQLKRLRPP